jgi:type IV pilus biogenesis protein CpaD/CtpE
MKDLLQNTEQYSSKKITITRCLIGAAHDLQYHSSEAQSDSGLRATVSNQASDFLHRWISQDASELQAAAFSVNTCFAYSCLNQLRSKMRRFGQWDAAWVQVIIQNELRSDP